MIKKLFFKRNALILLSFIILITGFTNSYASKSTTVKLSTKDSTNPQLSGISELNILWLRSVDFNNFKGKTFFIFKFLFDHTFTLVAWPTKGKLRIKYPDKPSIELNVSKQKGIPFETGTYFANLLIYGKEIKKIKDSISVTKKNFVVFIPHIEKHQICYNIGLTNVDPDDENNISAFIDKIVTANPSPPRKYTY